MARAVMSMSSFRFTKADNIFLETSRLAGRRFMVRKRCADRYLDLLQRPYTDVRVEDIPRRLEAYYKARGYYDVKVVADGAPDEAVNGRVPVHIVISPGPFIISTA